MKKSEVIELVQGLVDAFPNTSANVRTCAMYERLLEDLPADKTRQAVDALIKTSEFFPTIAKIREAVAELKKNRPVAEVLAEEARLIAEHEARCKAELDRKAGK